MKTILAALLAAFILSVPAAASSHAALHSPWDSHFIHPTPRPYACPAVAALPRNIVLYDYYSDARKSIPDPARLRAYRRASAAMHRVMRQSVRAADFYLRTGSTQAAACALHILDTQAAARSMTGSMASNQSYYVQNWTLASLAVVYLKVRLADAGTLSERSQIVNWMLQVARSTRGYFSARHAKHANDGSNNHYYWAGFALMSVGIAANDRGIYNWGVGTYRFGVSQIAPDGTLPLEMARGRRALHYHLFAAAPLVTMAEFGEANGQHLYSADHDALHRLVNRCVSGLENNAWFARKTGVPQDEPHPRLLSSDVAWMQPCEKRFPDPAIRRLLARVSSRSILYLGGTPPP